MSELSQDLRSLVKVMTADYLADDQVKYIEQYVAKKCSKPVTQCFQKKAANKSDHPATKLADKEMKSYSDHSTQTMSSTRPKRAKIDLRVVVGVEVPKPLAVSPVMKPRPKRYSLRVNPENIRKLNEELKLKNDSKKTNEKISRIPIKINNNRYKIEERNQDSPCRCAQLESLVLPKKDKNGKGTRSKIPVKIDGRCKVEKENKGTLHREPSPVLPPLRTSSGFSSVAVLPAVGNSREKDSKSNTGFEAIRQATMPDAHAEILLSNKNTQSPNEKKKISKIPVRTGKAQQIYKRKIHRCLSPKSPVLPPLQMSPSFSHFPVLPDITTCRGNDIKEKNSGNKIITMASPQSSHADDLPAQNEKQSRKGDTKISKIPVKIGQANKEGRFYQDPLFGWCQNSLSPAQPPLDKLYEISSSPALPIIQNSKGKKLTENKDGNGVSQSTMSGLLPAIKNREDMFANLKAKKIKKAKKRKDFVPDRRNKVKDIYSPHKTRLDKYAPCAHLPSVQY